MRKLVQMLVVGSCLAFAVLPCLGEEPAEPGADERDTELERRIRDYDRDLERRRIGLLGAGISHPLRLSGSIGAMYVRQHRDYDCTTVCDFRGPFFQFEPGISGIRAGVGYGLIVGEKARNRYYLRRVLVAFGLQGALLRTWGDASLEWTDQTFLGTEADFTVTQVNFRLGLYRSISDGPGEGPWLVSGGIGWGF